MLRRFVDGTRPLQPPYLPDDMWHMVDRCWQQDASARPSSVEIVQASMIHVIETSPMVDIVSKPTLNVNTGRDHRLQHVFLDEGLP